MQNPFSMFAEDYEASVIFGSQSTRSEQSGHMGRPKPANIRDYQPSQHSTDLEREEAWACQRFPLLEGRHHEQTNPDLRIRGTYPPRDFDRTSGNTQHLFMPASKNPAVRAAPTSATKYIPHEAYKAADCGNDSSIRVIAREVPTHGIDKRTAMEENRIRDAASREASDKAEAGFIEHSSGQRIFTEAVIVKALRAQYPGNLITTVPIRSSNLINYAAAGHASCSPISTTDGADPARKASGISPGMNQHVYLPPLRRLHGEQGAVLEKVVFGRYKYEWRGSAFIVYVVEGVDQFMGIVPLQYVIGGTREEVDSLILEAGTWGNELHEEIWV